jgi:hypothetical protein
VQCLPAACLPPLHKPAEAEAEGTVAVVAEATWAAALAEVTWAALAEVTWVASAEVTWEVLAELTSAALAEVTWRASAEITLTAEGVISRAAAFTTTALVVRITHDTTGLTPAPIEWRAYSLVADARISLSHEPRISADEANVCSPKQAGKPDAAPCGIRFNSRNSIFADVSVIRDWQWASSRRNIGPVLSSV